MNMKTKTLHCYRSLETFQLEIETKYCLHLLCVSNLFALFISNNELEYYTIIKFVGFVIDLG